MCSKRMIRPLLSLLLAAFAFTGCSGKAGTAGAGSVKIKAANWDSTITPYFISLIDTYKKNQKAIDLEILDIPAADYTQKLTVMLNSGSDLDVFFVKDADTVPRIVRRGLLTDLSGYIHRDNIDLNAYNGLVEYFRAGNKIMALPVRTDYYILYYNKDIFDKAAVPYPSNDMTWAEWEKLAGTLSSGRGGDRIYGALFHTWQACVHNWAIQDGKNTIMNTNYGFLKPYYEMALRMQKTGIIWDYATLRAGGIHYSSAFLQGNVAMMPMGTWFMSTIIDRINKGEAKLRWGIAVLPHPQGVEPGWTVGSVTPIGINRASDKKDAAWEFVKFVTSEEGAGICAAGNVIPGRANSQTLRSIALAPGMPENALEALTVQHIVLDRPYVDLAAEVNQMLGEEHSLIMQREISIDGGLSRMARRSKEIQGK